MAFTTLRARLWGYTHRAVSLLNKLAIQYMWDIVSKVQNSRSVFVYNP